MLGLQSLGGQGTESSSADRRSSSAAARLCAGIFLLYQRNTGVRQSDAFLLNGETWSAFEQAALPEMTSFQFYDHAQDSTHTPNSVLADAMASIWLSETFSKKTPSTLQVVTELANQIAARYEITPIDRRSRKRASLGLDILA